MGILDKLTGMFGGNKEAEEHQRRQQTQAAEERRQETFRSLGLEKNGATRFEKAPQLLETAGAAMPRQQPDRRTEQEKTRDATIERLLAGSNIQLEPIQGAPRQRQEFRNEHDANQAITSPRQSPAEAFLAQSQSRSASGRDIDPGLRQYARDASARSAEVTREAALARQHENSNALGRG